MKVMVIVKASKSSEAGELPSTEMLAAMGEFNQKLVEAGVMVDGAGLRPSREGARVRFSGTERLVTDGPFAETKELIAGYWIWNVQSIEEAIEWVKQCPNPMPEESDIEIRRFYEVEDFGPAFTAELREKEAVQRAVLLGLQAPNFCDVEEMIVVGMNQSYDMVSRSAIPQQWDRFNDRTKPLGISPSADYFGVSWKCDSQGNFEYLVGTKASEIREVPADFTSLTIPAGRYVVFEYVEHISKFPSFPQKVFKQWAPESGITIGPGPWLERYTPKFDPAVGVGGIELWIPIAEA